MFFFFREKKNARTFFSPDSGDCRSRKMLENEYLVAKFGFDTADTLRLSKFGGHVIHFIQSTPSLSDEPLTSTIGIDTAEQIHSKLGVDFLRNVPR